MSTSLSKTDLQILKQQAKEVLYSNRTESSTIPSPTLYPHQWNWDSAFIAIGLSHFDARLAYEEILTLFEGQWKNGMVPHIKFHRAEKDYYPGPSFWACDNNPNSPENIKTSGITQPPILALAAYRIYLNSPVRQEAIEFLQSIYSNLCSYHNFFRNYRVSDETGLVSIIHPWESGLDNSPRWDNALSIIKPKSGTQIKRTDIKTVGESERPSNVEYSKYAYLIELFIEADYDQDSILSTCPFNIQPVLFNTLLYMDLEAHIKIAEIVNADCSEIMLWKLQLKSGIQNKLWKYKIGRYVDYDLHDQSLIICDTLANYAPLAAGIPNENQADRLFKILRSEDGYWPANGYPLPTVSLSAAEYDPDKYWRGPVWINTNWLMIQTFQKYGYLDEAQKLLRLSLQLVAENGFYEYFNPFSGNGLGADQFSWTAALVIDMIENNEWY